MSASAVVRRYGFEDLRRFAVTLGAGAGLAPGHASTLAADRLWFDTVGARTLGVAALPGWLEAIRSGRYDLKAEGRIVSERATVANFDAENGLPPIVLRRAAELAAEKARELTIGLVRVERAEPLASAAAIVAAMALGPSVGLVLGPDRSLGLALPSEIGLPLVLDTGLEACGVPNGAADERASSRVASAKRRRPPPLSKADGLVNGFWIGGDVLRPENGWLVLAVSTGAVGAPGAFQERLGALRHDRTAVPGRLAPDWWGRQRRGVIARGVPIADENWKELARWARKFGAEPPGPMSPLENDTTSTGPP